MTKLPKYKNHERDTESHDPAHWVSLESLHVGRDVCFVSLHLCNVPDDEGWHALL